MNIECRADKQLFLMRVKEIGSDSASKVALRLPFEESLDNVWRSGLSREDEKATWHAYIEFELQQGQLQRARQLYERDLISLDKDRHFWLTYVKFIEKTLKDPQLVRAKFENRIKLHTGGSKYETLEIMLEQALFEEE